MASAAEHRGPVRRPGAIIARPALLMPLAPILALVHVPLLAIAYTLEMIDGPTFGVGSFVCTGLVFLMCLPRMLAGGGVGFRHDAVGASLFLLVLVAVTSNFIAQLGDRGGPAAITMWQQFAMAFSQVLMFYVFRDISQYSDMSRPIMIAIDLVTLIVIGSFLAGMLGFAKNEAYGTRQFGVLGDQVAWLLSVVSVIYFARGRWLWFIACLAFLVLTQSRAPAFFAGLGIAATLLREPASVTSILKRILIVAALAAVIFVAPDLLRDTAERFRTTDLFYNERIFTMKYTFDLFTEHPLTGLGFNSHQFYFLSRIGHVASWYMILSTPVSTPLQMLADFGVFGFLCFLAAMAAAIRKSASLAGPTVLSLGPRATDAQFSLTGRALACWLIPFIIFNHTMSYILPVSMVTVMFFASLGIITGQAAIARRAATAARVARRRRPADAEVVETTVVSHDVEA